ncbi:hypothetical protein ACWIUD_09295 [Helicobacter sp. 23-1044]
MKEGFLDRLLREMRLRQIKPHLREFANPRVLDVGCGWEAKLLKEIEPFIAQGIGIDFKAPNIQTAKLRTFSYFFEKKGEVCETRTKSAESIFNSAKGNKNAESALISSLRDSANAESWQSAIKSNPCEAPESRPLRGAKNREKGCSSATRRFFARSESWALP